MAEAGEPRVQRVMVVDDEEMIRNFAARILRHAGYEVVLASDGPEALRISEQPGSFDLFVVDVAMPHMSGDELGRRLRQIDADVRVLYFTGYSDRLFDEKTTLWEKEAFLEKPVDGKALSEAVSLLLFGHTRGPAMSLRPTV